METQVRTSVGVELGMANWKGYCSENGFVIRNKDYSNECHGYRNDNFCLVLIAIIFFKEMTSHSLNY